MKIVSLKSDDGKQEIATSLQGKLFKQRSFQHQHVRIRSMHLSLIFVYVSKLKKFFLTVFIAESLFSLILINRWWWHLLWATIVQLYSEKIFCTSENYLARNCHNPSPKSESKVKSQKSKGLGVTLFCCTTHPPPPQKLFSATRHPIELKFLQ